MSIAPTETYTLAPILNAFHRCDRCSARAFVVTVLRWSPKLRQGGELQWCNHHWGKVRDAITPLCSTIIDETAQLTEHIRDDKGVR
jgi:hypothetical protein